MLCYSPECKAALLKKLLPPSNLSVVELARQEGISEVPLYAWRKQAKAGGATVPGGKKLPDDWPAEARFAVVLETAALSEIELSEYCRHQGLYPEQVGAWGQARADKKRIRELERELRCKEQALAEAAAILVMRKKLNAY